MGWILAQQGFFERSLAAAVRASRADGSALWWLGGLELRLRRAACRRARSRQGRSCLLYGGQRAGSAARHRSFVSRGPAAGRRRRGARRLAVADVSRDRDRHAGRCRHDREDQLSRGRASGFLARLAQSGGARGGVARTSEQNVSARYGRRRRKGWHGGLRPVRGSGLCGLGTASLAGSRARPGSWTRSRRHASRACRSTVPRFTSMGRSAGIFTRRTLQRSATGFPGASRYRPSWRRERGPVRVRSWCWSSRSRRASSSPASRLRS